MVVKCFFFKVLQFEGFRFWLRAGNWGFEVLGYGDKVSFVCMGVSRSTGS